MRNIADNNLNRAVSLLNFEHENMSRAENMLLSKYKIPKFYLSLIVHKIFYRLGTHDFAWPSKSLSSLWDQFHYIASEEIKTMNFE